MTRQEAMKKLGIHELRDHQTAPIKAICEGHDTFVRMPTAVGKSLLYQLPALIYSPRMTIVISPLKALQADQVAALRAKGVQARLLNSSLPTAERAQVLEEVRQQAISLLYIAPEQLENQEVRIVLEKADIAMVAVDEAHILAHDQDSFRKAYRTVGRFVDCLEKRPVVIALTATATNRDRKTIVKSLRMQEPAVFTAPIRRENLRLEIKIANSCSKTDKKQKIWAEKRRLAEEALHAWDGNGSVIIYCPTVRAVKQLYRELKAEGWDVGAYHGKMTDKKRAIMQERFMAGNTRIIVATNAFGLGIDKPDIRRIIHVGLPLSFDGFVQEIGRAGRDGKKARCALIYAPSDLVTNSAILRHSLKKKQRAAALARLNALDELIRSKHCLWRGIERYFGEKPGKKCGVCCICRQKHKKF